jgi:SNF2 family DNA or RNA helicase
MKRVRCRERDVPANGCRRERTRNYDPWWNPAVEDQATDRAHRIGQDKPVFVYKLVTQGTVEERMLELQQRKKALAAGIYEAGGNDAAALDAADIERLFEPLG